MNKGAFFLTRLFIGMVLEDARTQKPIDLGEVLRHSPEFAYARQVRMGQGLNQTRACRLVCLRVSAQVAKARRRRFKAHARTQTRTDRQPTASRVMRLDAPDYQCTGAMAAAGHGPSLVYAAVAD